MHYQVLPTLKSFPQENDLLRKKLDLTGIKWPRKIFQQFGQDNINNPAHRRVLCTKARVNLMNVDCKESDIPPTLFTKQLMNEFQLTTSAEPQAVRWEDSSPTSSKSNNSVFSTTKVLSSASSHPRSETTQTWKKIVLLALLS